MTKKEKINMKEKYNDRDISWLSFNERVLQEAIDPNVPPLEKIKFLSIFSSNLDEFFRVRVASLRRLIIVNKNERNKEEQAENQALLQKIQHSVVTQQERFRHIYEDVKSQLALQKIFIINENELSKEQLNYVHEYFTKEVVSHLFPVILDNLRDFPFLKDRSIYLAVKLSKKDGSLRTKFALIEVPTEVLSRFYVLPKTDNNTYILLLEDVIRTSLDMLFRSLDFDTYQAHVVKLTRDQELDIDSDLHETLLNRIKKGLKKRDRGTPVRMVYDSEIPHDLMGFMIKKIKLNRESLIPGGRYHNFKDFWNFPNVPGAGLKYANMPNSPIPDLDNANEMFDVIKKKDILLHHPYHSFNYIIRLLREAAIDPNVYAIKITLYRVAKNSNVVNALLNAIQNGKQVTVVIELQARFDEESNIYWNNRLREAGANVIVGTPELKIHCKTCLIFRKENNKTVHYVHLSTGNYNGVSSRSYSDMGIITVDSKITQDVVKLFSYINNYPRIQYKFKHILVSPLYMKNELLRLIDVEIKNAKNKTTAFINLKLNSLSDEVMIDKLYEASQAGVKIKIIVRGICRIKPGIKNLSENIEIISIIDRYLEHTRIYVFGNGGNEKIYLGSADWMTRNLDRRIEVLFPVFDEKIRSQIKEIIQIQLNDNVKARIIDADLNNSYKPFSLPSVRSQMETFAFWENQ